MVIAHGLDRFGNFSHYTYSTIPPDAHSFAFLLILCSPFSHPVYLAFIIPTLNLLGYFYFPSLLHFPHTSFSYDILSDVQTIPFSPYVYSAPTSASLVLTSYLLTSNFLLLFLHIVFISVGPFYTKLHLTQNCTR